MMPNLKFVVLSAPGLPPWPPLLFDAENRNAVVSARVATWRSVENGCIACRILWVVVAVWIFRLVWLGTSASSVKAEAVIVTAMTTLIIAGLALPLMLAAFQGFFARQIFCSRIKVCFRPDAITFRSRLYSRPVVLWRSWAGTPVQCRFEITKDPEAVAQSRHSKPNQPNQHFMTACLLRIIVATTNPHRAAPTLQQPVSLREIPMMEIDEKDALRLSIVLSAAASLTTKDPNELHTSQQPAEGIDIDVG